MAQQHFCFVEFTYPRVLNWTLAQYGEAVLNALAEEGITSGWILAESFSSQVAWEIVRNPRNFHPAGVILAGGFVSHPCKILARLGHWLLGNLPAPFWKFAFSIYAIYARFRHRHAPETGETVKDFIARRTPEDFLAMRARINLILANDPSAIVRQLTLPVFSMAGLVDPIVFWWRVNSWLRHNCAGFQEARLILQADHTVLATAPVPAFHQVQRWIAGFTRAPAHPQFAQIPPR